MDSAPASRHELQPHVHEWSATSLLPDSMTVLAMPVRLVVPTRPRSPSRPCELKRSEARVGAEKEACN